MPEFDISRHVGRIEATPHRVGEVSALRQVELLDAEGRTIAGCNEDDARSIHFVARTADRLAGYVQYDPMANRLRQMVVVPEQRGGKLGRTLVECVRDEARRRGARELRVHAWTRSIDFYRRVGFEAVGEVHSDARVPWQAMCLRWDS